MKSTANRGDIYSICYLSARVHNVELTPIKLVCKHVWLIEVNSFVSMFQHIVYFFPNRSFLLFFAYHNFTTIFFFFKSVVMFGLIAMWEFFKEIFKPPECLLLDTGDK